MPDHRRLARELALRVLYEVDVGRQPAREALNRAVEQLATGVRASLVMAVRQAQAAIRPDTSGPAVFTSRTVLRERDRIRVAVSRALERTATGFDDTLLSLFAEAAQTRMAAEPTKEGQGEGRRSGGQPVIERALWALNDAAKKPFEQLERTLQRTSLNRHETAEARRIAEQAVARMRHVLERRLELTLSTARMVAQLVRGALRHRDEMDAELGALTGDWPLERQSAADRNILRLAAFEIAYRPDIPAPVVMNEAIELAKRYGSEESARFVNGVLAAFAARRSAEDLVGAGASPPGTSGHGQADEPGAKDAVERKDDPA